MYRRRTAPYRGSCYPKSAASEGLVSPKVRTPDVVKFGMSPFSWRRHSCLLGRDSSRPSSQAASTVPERREESRRRRHECLRHVMAQVNFPNYPKSPAGIRSSEGGAGGARLPVRCPSRVECRRHSLSPPRISRHGVVHGMAQPIFPGHPKLRSDLGSSETWPRARRCRLPGTSDSRSGPLLPTSADSQKAAALTPRSLRRPRWPRWLPTQVL